MTRRRLHFKKIINDSFTGVDGATYDVGRILWFMLVVSFIGLSIYRAKSFDYLGFASAGSALLVSGATNLTIKAKTEPTR